MKERIEIEVHPFIKKEIQAVYGNDDNLYVVEVKAIQPWQRFMLYNKDELRIVDITVEEALKPHEVKTKEGIKMRKQNVWDEGELHVTTKRKEIDCLKNYYPTFANSFEIINPEAKYKSFNEYYDSFTSSLNEYKTKGK